MVELCMSSSDGQNRGCGWCVVRPTASESRILPRASPLALDEMTVLLKDEKWPSDIMAQNGLCKVFWKSSVTFAALHCVSSTVPVTSVSSEYRHCRTWSPAVTWVLALMKCSAVIHSYNFSCKQDCLLIYSGPPVSVCILFSYVQYAVGHSYALRASHVSIIPHKYDT